MKDACTGEGEAKKGEEKTSAKKEQGEGRAEGMVKKVKEPGEGREGGAREEGGVRREEQSEGKDWEMKNSCRELEDRQHSRNEERNSSRGMMGARWVRKSFADFEGSFYLSSSLIQ